MKRNIVYFGNSLDMVSILNESNYFELKIWISEEKFADEHDKYISIYQIEHKYVSNVNELERYVGEFDDKIQLAIMYSFGIIISNEILKKIDIYNFHPGSLKRNRGRNPIEWSILLGWKKDEMSLHKIDESIDTGQIISSEKINISYLDTVKDITKKMNNTIPILLFDLKEYLLGRKKAKTIKPGIYRKRVSESDYTIDMDNDSTFVIKNKIRSQKTYNGAILVINNEKRFIKNYDELLEIKKFKKE